MQYITEVKSERIKVYRLGSRQDNLIGKNAASIEGVIKFIDQQDRRGIGTGSFISAYEVEVMGGFGNCNLRKKDCVLNLHRVNMTTYTTSCALKMR